MTSFEKRVRPAAPCRQADAGKPSQGEAKSVAEFDADLAARRKTELACYLERARPSLK
jgi:hypothetical protein